MKSMNNLSCELTQDLAELIGAIIGDGAIRFKPEIHQYYVEIVCSINERPYLNYLSRIVQSELGLKAKLAKRERALRLKIYSKRFVLFLIKDLAMCCNYGKGQNIRIPGMIINDTKLLRRCIRGIADTDGSLFYSRKSHTTRYPSVEISTSSKMLAKQLIAELNPILRVRGRSFSKKNALDIYRISINGDYMVNKWMEIIGFSNERHLSRYRKENGATEI